MRIDKVVAQFEVWPDHALPFPKFKVKVLERNSGDFLAVPNVFVRDIESQDPVYISGIGGSIEEAFNDLITRFQADVRDNVPIGGLSELHFEWSAPEEF